MNKVEVLVATMGRDDLEIFDKMNIQSDVVFANQHNKTEFISKKINEQNVKMITTATRGVGINRNLAIIYSSCDFLLFADDDMRYNDGYPKLVEDAFIETPQADVILFNLENAIMHNKKKRIRWFNYMRYGTVRIAIRRKTLLEKNICFTELFGGGAPFSSGEDSMFLHECLNKGLKLYTCNKSIAKLVNDRPSTWNNGNIEKTCYDKGVWLRLNYPILKHVLKYYFAVRLSNKKIAISIAIKKINEGIKEL